MRRRFSLFSALASPRLPYDHRYHFGNGVDCFKHVVLLCLLRSMREKEAGFTYVETHAGAGFYKPNAQLKEHEQGLDRVLKSDTDYARLQKESFQRRGMYLGSAALAATQLRPQDDLLLFEKEESVQKLLAENFANTVLGDGYAGLRATRSQKRALIFVDPPYQLGSDTDQTLQLISHLRTHWKAARIAIWYPASTLAFKNNERLSNLAKNLDCDSLKIEFKVEKNNNSTRLSSSGFLLLQPPFQIQDKLQGLLPPLGDLLREYDDDKIITTFQAFPAVIIKKKKS